MLYSRLLQPTDGKVMLDELILNFGNKTQTAN